ncbi:MAG: tetratricopeptide repeat protein [Acidobacteriota bacterium]|jgi:tetratricopeptide (TPR) repeat protein
MKRGRFAVMFLALIMPVTAGHAQFGGLSGSSQRAAGSPDSYMAAATRFYVDGEFDLAIESYSQALKIAPKFTEALLGRGLAYKGKGDIDNAIKDFRAIVRIDPRGKDAYTAHLIQREIFQMKGDLKSALAELDRAVAIRPNDGSIYGARGALKLAIGDLNGALLDLDKAAALAPNDSFVFDNRGLARTAKGNLEGAIEDFSQAMKLNFRQPSFMVHRGDAKLAKGDTEGALADYDQALKWDRGYAPGHVQRGLLKLAQGQEAEAQAEFEFALKLKPSLAKTIDEAKAKIRKDPEVKK